MPVLMLIAAALMSSNALAEKDITERFSAAYQGCIMYGELHNAVAIPAETCAERELLVQDARLNRAYKALIARLSAPQKSTLRDSQRTWIRTRDQTCADHQYDRAECLAVETYKRTQFLIRYR